MNVLILEDMPDQAFIIDLYLTKMGFKTIVSYSGYEALQIVKKADIIVTDLAMPELSGIEFIKYVRQQSQTPIVVISAYCDEDTKDDAFKAGANYYMVKPIIQTDLKRIFKQWQAQIQKTYF